MFIASDEPCIVGALTRSRGSLLAGIPEARFMNARSFDARTRKNRDGDRGLDVSELVRTGAAAGGGRRAVGISRRRVRDRRRRRPGPGVLRMLPTRRRAAGGADAAVHRHLARHHHSDLDPLLARPLRSGRGRHGNPQSVVAAGAGRRDRRQRHRALRAGAAVQDRVRDGGLVGRRAPVAGARDLEVRRRSPAGPADEGLRLLRRASLHA